MGNICVDNGAALPQMVQVLTNLESGTMRRKIFVAALAVLMGVSVSGEARQVRSEAANYMEGVNMR